jgi:phosphatidylinositol alpha-1,6-mannosyltransferase
MAGGLQQLARCVARALASSAEIRKLGIWGQMDPRSTEPFIERVVQTYAHPGVDLDVRTFGGSRVELSSAIAATSLRGSYDRIMYLLLNQAVLSLLPGHPPYSVWEIGWELMTGPLPWWKCRALRHADVLLSISRNTTAVASLHNPQLPAARVVHLCTEPPLFSKTPLHDPVAAELYDPARRQHSVLIVGNMYRGMLYKGHQQLIAAWPQVVGGCPSAELWIASGGDGQLELEAQARMLPRHVAKKIRFLGYLDQQALHDRYRQCRVFAMPSTGEGFGLVFVEAARYGIPCIGGKYDAVKEIVVHNETGLLVEQHPHDLALACLRLLNDDRLAKRLGNAGRQRYLENFRFCHFRDRLLRALDLDST